jgi:hypothetical protein
MNVVWGLMWQHQARGSYSEYRCLYRGRFSIWQEPFADCKFMHVASFWCACPIVGRADPPPTIKVGKSAVLKQSWVYLARRLSHFKLEKRLKSESVEATVQPCSNARAAYAHP